MVSVTSFDVREAAIIANSVAKERVALLRHTSIQLFLTIRKVFYGNIAFYN